MSESGAVEADLAAATGGSPRSEISRIDDRRWKPRRGLALAIHAAVIIVPLAGATLAVELATRAIVRPETLLPFVAWLLALMALATIALRLVDRQVRRLLPLATMLRLSLVFPDRAPSRFSIALKTGSGRTLERAVANAEAQRAFATPQETAEAVVTLLGAVSRHDRLTRGHCERVRAYSDLIGQQLRLDPESAARLHWAALLHDVGKLDVPAEILNKKGRLTPEEWEQVHAHPAESDKWLVGLRPWLGDWSRAASEHHERFDGDGYPYGLAGEEISLAGRIVAVADAFDVMTAARSYKKPFPAAQARVELTDNAGTQFDPDVVRAFLAISLGDLRRVTGPIAWLATVPELVRLGVTSAIAPARTAVTAAGVAAASLVPVVVAPPPVTPQMESTFVAADAGEVSTSTSTPTPRRSGNQGATADSDAATPARAPAASGAPADAAAPAADAPAPRPADTLVPATIPGPQLPPLPPPPGPELPPPPPASTTTTTAPPPPAHAPVASNDSPAPLLLTGHLVLDVLANDSDVDGNLDRSSLRIVSKSSGAQLQQITVINGKIDIVPKQLVVGPMSFVYEICDTTQLCATAKVTITVVLTL